MTAQISVVIVDDHAIVRSGLRLLIEREKEMVVLDEAADTNEAIFRVLEHKPGVVLIDVTMPGESGIDAIPRLLEASPESKVLVLSMHDDPRYVRDAFAAGATGYVLKEAADAELVAAIREIAAGGSYVNPALGARVVTSEAKEHAEALADPLSEREHQVLRLLALGHTNQEIAGALFISVRTAETHRAHIMQKLGLASRAELVRYALGRQILEPE
jgi:DNA-binding NarL/FixJ family response regulator